MVSQILMSQHSWLSSILGRASSHPPMREPWQGWNWGARASKPPAVQQEAARRGRGLTTDEARGLEDLLFLLLLAAEVGEGVDDHPKDEVQHNDDDDEEEQEVVYHPGRKEGLLHSEGHREDGFQQGRWLCSQAPREKYVGA